MADAPEKEAMEITVADLPLEFRVSSPIQYSFSPSTHFPSGGNNSQRAQTIHK